LKGSSASFGSASDLERRSSRDRLILPIATLYPRGAISRVKLIISSKMAAAAEGDEENLIALNKLDAFASQARGVFEKTPKVAWFHFRSS
jgi:hypothetical protein